mmetsp:Transcript_36812/g.60942  ORF Transcript_36812/g.60942 Transcript_36812/m.60942 type:complete len:204 (+) Transcript_36812:1117-1728(+)
MIHRLQDGNTIAKMVEEIVNVPLDAERVDPHPEGPFLSRVSPVIVRQLFHQLELLLSWRLKPRTCVEERSDETKIEFVIALDDICRLDRKLSAESPSLSDDVLRSFVQVGVVQNISGTLLLTIYLLEQDGVNMRVLEVRAEVGDTFRMARLRQVVIDPAHQQLLRREFEKCVELLTGLEHAYKRWAFLEVDVREQRHLHHLPD